MRLRQINGNGFILLYGLITAAAAVYLKEVEQQFLPLIVLFYSFFIAFIFYAAISFSTLWPQRALIKRNWKLIASLNLMTAVTWVAYFYSLYMLAPSVVAAFFLGTFPLATIAMSYRQYQHRKVLMTEVIAATLIIPCLLPLTNLSWTLCLPVIAAITASNSSISSFKLSQQGFSATHVLAVRFVLACVVMGVLVSSQHVSLSLHGLDFMKIALVSIATLMLPLYFLQRGLALTHPIRVAFLIQFIPIFTYLFEFLGGQKELNMHRLVMLALLTVILMIITRIQQKRKLR